MNALVPVTKFETIPAGYCVDYERAAHRARTARMAAAGDSIAREEAERIAARQEAARKAADEVERMRLEQEALKVDAFADAIVKANRAIRAACVYPQVQRIKHVVAVVYGFTIAEIDAARRTADIVEPRQIAIFLASKLTRKSLPEIGRRFGNRDHTTILHAIRKIGARAKADPEFATHLGLLRAEIEGDI